MAEPQKPVASPHGMPPREVLKESSRPYALSKEIPREPSKGVAAPKEPAQEATKEAPKEAGRVPNKRMIIDALVLAFAHSDVREVVGTDALRMVLDARYVDMVKTPGTLDLQPVWQLLEQQPEFVPDTAVAPLCRFKMWEAQLGITIALPKAIGISNKLEVNTRASKCRVPENDLQRILNPKNAPAAQPQQPTIATPATAAEIAEAESQGKKFKIWGAIALVAVAAAGALVFLTFQGGATSLNPKTFAGEIPLREVLKSADSVGALLADPAWLAKPEGDRRKQVGDALGRLQSSYGVNALIIMDATGKVKASAIAQSGSAPNIVLSR